MGRRGTALTQSQQQRSQRHKHQRQSPLRVLLEVNVMQVVNLASLFLEIPRQRLIPTARLVEEAPCNLGGHATRTFVNAPAAEIFLCKMSRFSFLYYLVYICIFARRQSVDSIDDAPRRLNFSLYSRPMDPPSIKLTEFLGYIHRTHYALLA